MLLRRAASAAAAATALHCGWRSGLLARAQAAEPAPPSEAPATEVASTAPAAEAETEAESKPCLHMLLLPESSETVLRLYPPVHSRVAAERVLLHQCIPDEHAELPVRALAIAQDARTQSVLVAIDTPPWPRASAVPVGGVGYPVLPISLVEEGEAAAPDAAGGGDDDDAPPLPWEMAEELWRRLERAGILHITRDERALPSSVSLADGAAEWEGELPPAGARAAAGKVSLRLIPPAQGGLPLLAQTMVPECGFCRFMKAGPCGEAFELWEACIDRAREGKQDFVDLCGPQTLKLKACTDEHPEYYGMLGGGDEDEAAKEQKAEPTAPVTGAPVDAPTPAADAPADAPAPSPPADAPAATDGDTRSLSAPPKRTASSKYGGAFAEASTAAPPRRTLSASSKYGGAFDK